MNQRYFGHLVGLTVNIRLIIPGVCGLQYVLVTVVVVTVVLLVSVVRVSGLH